MILLNYEFDRLIERRRTNSLKWDYVHKYFQTDLAQGELLPLWVADMDFPCAQPIIDALRDRVEHGIFGYSEYPEEYKYTVCQWMMEQFGWSVRAENLFFSPGIVPAIGFLINALTSEGDGIIIQPPVYSPFQKTVEANNRVVVENGLINKNGYYTMDFNDLEIKIKRNHVKMLLLCNPHNPVGRVWTLKELTELGEICLKHGVIIVSDEIHSDLIREGMTHTPIAKIFDNHKDIITCTSPSKTFNMAGLYLSNIMINDVIFQRKWVEQTSGRYSIGMPNPLSVTAAQAAYQHGNDWLRQVREYLDQNLLFFAKYLKERLPESVMTPTEGTYLGWIDFRAYEKPGIKVDELFIRKAGIILENGLMFDKNSQGFERINFACPQKMLKICVDKMHDVINP